MRRPHDIGGQAAGTVRPVDHALSLSERRIDAMMLLMRRPGREVFNVDEMRHTIESLPKDSYERFNYYERWVYALRALLEKKGVLTPAAIDARIRQVRARLAAKG
ncbi:MAG: nitrile hydratase subunit beta [Alphaproteobacteria bacterium]|nr:nitrile hydratase subunit beta [Alphaproteobacteria bacterium]